MAYPSYRMTQLQPSLVLALFFFPPATLTLIYIFLLCWKFLLYSKERSFERSFQMPEHQKQWRNVA